MGSKHAFVRNHIVILSIIVTILGATIMLEYAHTAEQHTKASLIHDTIHEEVLRLHEDGDQRYAREGVLADNNKIAVYVHLDSEESILELPDYVTPIMTSGEIFSALLTMDEIYLLGELDIVSKITLPEFATPHYHYKTQGVTYMGAEEMHRNGFTGEGITIAVIDLDFIPNDPEIRHNVKTHKIFDSYGTCDDDPRCGDSGSSHGTAVAEIIVDMAPDAELILYTIDGTSIAYINAVVDAMREGADIVSVSLGYDTIQPVTGNQFRSGLSRIAGITTQAEAAGVIPIISAGNEANEHVLTQYNPSRSIDPASIKLDDYQSVHEFNPAANGVHKACLPVRTYDWSYFYLFWSDYWDAASNDYDLFLYDSTMSTILDDSTYTQKGSGDPREKITELSFSSRDDCLVVASYASSEDHQIRILVQGGGSIRDKVPGVTRFGSISSPADAHGSIAVGAIDYTLGTLAHYSSSGPTDDGRPKPEICGLANVYSHQHSTGFSGTSASAPHVTGLIATLLEANPDLKGTGKDHVLNILQKYSKHDSTYSVDNLCGADSGLAYLANYPGMPSQMIEGSYIPVPFYNLTGTQILDIGYGEKARYVYPYTGELLHTAIFGNGTNNAQIELEPCANYDCVVVNIASYEDVSKMERRDFFLFILTDSTAISEKFQLTLLPKR